MHANMRLMNIPPEIQKRYSIGSEVDVEASSAVNGGHFTFINKKGKEVAIDAVELTGHDIAYKDL